MSPSPAMMVLSLAVNVLVLVPVCWGLMTGSAGMEAAYGPDAPALRILVCAYLAILALSVVLLAWPAGRAALGPGLLAVQVGYKLLTVPMLGIGHPVAIANLAVALLHAVTLATIRP